MLDESLPLAFAYLNRTAFLVWLSGGERPVKQDQHGVRNRDEGALLASCGKSPKAVLEKAVFGFRSRPCAFHECGSKPSVTARDFSRLGLAARAVIPGTNPGPGAQVRFRRKLLHVGTDLSENARCSVLLDTGNGL